MKIKLLVFFLLILPFLFLNKQVQAEKPVENKIPSVQIEGKTLDKKAKILSQYLAQFNSPLQYHAQDFIDAANSFGLDWRMMPAIAGVESTFGKQIPGGFNAWGWGVYGNQAIYFDSWREGIFTIAKGLKENYINKGLTEPYSINRAYAASPHWGWKVAYFMADIDQFTNKFDQNTIILADKTPSIAAVSGRLAFWH